MSLSMTRPDIDFLLTNECSNKCKHCVFESREKLCNELNLRDVLKAFHNIKDVFKIDSISLTGGEPLLKDNFIELYQEARNLFNVTVITTGIGLNANIKKCFEKLPPTKIIVSIYGLNEKHNSFCENNSAFLTLVNLLEFAKERKLDVGINIICHLDNFKEVPQILNFVFENNYANIVKLLTLSPVGRGRKIQNKVLSCEQWVFFTQWIYQLKVSSQFLSKKTIKIEKHVDYTYNKLNKCSIIDDDDRTISSCIHVDSSGDIYPCTMFVRNPHFKIGNIMYPDSINLNKFKRKISRLCNKILLENCQECKLKNNCIKGCIGYHIALGKDYRCGNPNYVFGCPDCYTEIE